MVTLSLALIASTAYFDMPPAHTAVVCGSVRDVCATADKRGSVASRYFRSRRLIDQANTYEMERPYAKTANCAVRRAAFERAGGFVDRIRSVAMLTSPSACLMQAGKSSFAASGRS